MIRPPGIEALRRVLCLGAHSDDIEIGAGATVRRLLQEMPGVEIAWVVLSGDEERRAEARAGFELFAAGAGRASLACHGFRDGCFPGEANRIREQFEALKAFDPDLILTHGREDRHQDHRVVSDLTWSTFRRHQIWEYEIPKWDGDLGRPNLYVPVEAPALEEKIDFLHRAFASQRGRPWFDGETFRGLARLRGVEACARYAEAFTARKLVLA